VGRLVGLEAVVEEQPSHPAAATPRPRRRHTLNRRRPISLQAAAGRSEASGEESGRGARVQEDGGVSSYLLRWFNLHWNLIARDFLRVCENPATGPAAAAHGRPAGLWQLVACRSRSSSATARARRDVLRLPAAPAAPPSSSPHLCPTYGIPLLSHHVFFRGPPLACLQITASARLARLLRLAATRMVEEPQGAYIGPSLQLGRRPAHTMESF